MSISKSGKRYVTEEEIASARANANAVDYARRKGYHLKGTNGRYELEDDHTIVFKDVGADKGMVYLNRIGKHGDALFFMQEYEGRSFVDAVLELADPSTARETQQVRQTYTEPERKPFSLPKAAENNDIVQQYLVEHRKIDSEIVQRLLQERRLYQSKKFDSVVMVGYDAQNIPRSALIRSTEAVTGNGKSFKGNKTSSDLSYSFVIHGHRQTDTIVAVESPIEAMSYWSIAKAFGSPALQYDILALGGANITAGLERYLQDHPNIKNIVVGLNNDSKEHGHEINTGATGVERIQKKFGAHYHIRVHMPSLNDWNDTIVSLSQHQSVLQQLQEKSRSTEKSQHTNLTR